MHKKQTKDGLEASRLQRRRAIKILEAAMMALISIIPAIVPTAKINK